ncbi:DNA mismatch repair endonuclease MutH [Psychrobium sp. 1_MG-2023]|uniref:DNA mismatch repair endonuclease MutH n=1 Tax=Psychrobium sp. 1_MG-2023 TaxID=3062624 RepID=UPI000C32D497|nr:DNA mismatch repair endonuclease MutH [Psychrobium sp. 1_MG-2023]MDP2560902.1 DNA mismatch repair endonuclease MutH [Psychrobium sp. 1_MG-2023]PKF55976.1 DNA mismatch repair endonuclease MutH [Alteromonadales bacterium alter-6D02]
MILPPMSEQELLAKADAIAGLSLAQLAMQMGLDVPESLRRNKGWIGNLLEVALGASAGSKPEQDFPHLGVELKTIPINRFGKPLETTFVCITPLIGITGIQWQQSNIRNKLAKVLWVPILSEKELAIGERQIGTPFLWQPSAEQESLLQQDWEEIMELITLGKIEQISAKTGQVMQLRPKGANSKALTDAIGEDGSKIKTLPRGFYLKIPFTQQILQQQFNL